MGGQRKISHWNGEATQESLPQVERVRVGGSGSVHDRPVWDNTHGILCWGNLFKVYSQEAECQREVLRAIDELGWLQEWIKNPLPHDPVIPRHRKLLTVVKNLDRTFRDWPMRFHADTKRDLIRWERLV
jgi:hypothetical protein